jgi:RNA polymerase sigma-70 factor, ECF subfamily
LHIVVGQGLKSSAISADPVESIVPPSALSDSGNYRTLDENFERVYSEYFQFVWRSTRGLGVPEAFVDDVVQEVFIIVHRKLPDFEERGALRSWLYGITRRVCKDHRRSATRRGTQLELDPEREYSTGPNPHEYATQRQALKSIESFADTLDEEHRDIFFLALIEGLPTVEVADTLGINANTTYSRVRTLRRNLAAHLELAMQNPGEPDGRP